MYSDISEEEIINHYNHRKPNRQYHHDYQRYYESGHRTKEKARRSTQSSRHYYSENRRKRTNDRKPHEHIVVQSSNKERDREKTKKKRDKYEDSRSREKTPHRSRHKNHNKHKDHKEQKDKTSRKDKRRLSRSKSVDSLNSASLINEIRHNETAKDVLQNDKTILKSVISAIKKETDTNNNMDTSYTSKHLPAPIKPSSGCKRLNDKTTPENNSKKQRVLDLPMPPEIKLETNLLVKKSPSSLVSDPQSIDQIGKKFILNWDQITQSSCPLNKGVDTKDHAEEMKIHLKINTSILTPSDQITPEPITKRHYRRPTVIGKEQKITKTEFPNLDINMFKIIEQVGEGTYGKVYKAVNIVDKNIVAMKLIRMENEHQGFPITCLREIKNLKILKHENIIELKDVVFNVAKFQTYLVFEFMNHDLLGLMNNPEVRFTEGNIFQIISQVIKGLKFCHSKQIIHRDLKSSNILLNNEGVVKLADFGLSRDWQPERPYTNKVISLWYRPIELLLGEEQYTPLVDIWSVGCIMTELYKRMPLFPFSDEIDTVDAIYKLCGTPNYNSWPEAKKLPRFETLTHKTSRPRILISVLAKLMSPFAVDLVDKMLTLNPKKRITAEDALESNWIKSMKTKTLEPLIFPSIDCFEYRFKFYPRKKK